jgi:hypothetical protein
MPHIAFSRSLSVIPFRTLPRRGVSDLHRICGVQRRLVLPQQRAGGVKDRIVVPSLRWTKVHCQRAKLLPDVAFMRRAVERELERREAAQKRKRSKGRKS